MIEDNPPPTYPYSTRLFNKNLSLKVRIIWSLVFISIYAILLNIPLIGLASIGYIDFFSTLRSSFASHRGSLAELGVFPIILATIFVQLLVRTKALKLNLSNEEDKDVYRKAILYFSIFFGCLLSLFYPFLGFYGENLGTEVYLLLISQLLISQLIIILMVDLFQRGYGIGSGVGSFVFLGFSFNIFDGLFSLSPEPSGGFAWFRGVILRLFQVIFSNDPNAKFKSVLYSKGLAPDLVMFFMTIICLCIVILVSSIKIELEEENHEKIKYLFESSYLPILQTGAVLFIIQNIIILSGLFSFIAPPLNYNLIAALPLDMFVFFVLTVFLCGMFSSLGNKIRIDDQKESEQISITISWLGGFFIGVLTAITSFLVPLGTSFALVSSVFII